MSLKMLMTHLNQKTQKFQSILMKLMYQKKLMNRLMLNYQMYHLFQS
jgi:hypothetical protein